MYRQHYIGNVPREIKIQLGPHLLKLAGNLIPVIFQSIIPVSVGFTEPLTLL